ncbi:MAG: hypothetical protein IE909_18715, partial [Campylobacterales bacterium]|nr:hypothetical protein [Campylobacterales bacterium]
IAQDYSVDVREIIIELSNINIIDPSKNDILKAIKIVQSKKATSDIPLFANIRKSFNRNISFESLEILINELKSNAKKHNKKSVFNIVVTTTQNTFLSSYTQTSSEYIIGSCQINSFSQLEEIIGLIDGKIDIVFYDLEFKIDDSLLMKKYLLENIKRSKLLFYNDSEIWSKAIENILLGKSTKDLPYIYLNGKTYLGMKLMNSIKSLGVKISSKLTQEKFFDFIVGTEQGEIDISFVNAIGEKTIIIDAGIGSISQDILNYCYENKIEVLRVDMRVVLESEISQKEKSSELFEKVQGVLDNEKFTIVAGGYYGKEGSIIVDSIKQPTCVIGISNGNGNVKYTLNDEEIQRIEEFELKILKGI